MLIFEETIASAPVNALCAGDVIDLTLGGASSLLVRGSVQQADQDTATVAFEDGGTWLMTPRRSDEPQVGLIWTSSPTQEWVVRSNP